VALALESSVPIKARRKQVHTPFASQILGRTGTGRGSFGSTRPEFPLMFTIKLPPLPAVGFNIGPLPPLLLLEPLPPLVVEPLSSPLALQAKAEAMVESSAKLAKKRSFMMRGSERRGHAAFTGLSCHVWNRFQEHF
jgi:hypothetical protein